MRWFIIGLIGILLAGCASVSLQSDYPVHTFLLKRAVQIPGGEARTFFQNGHVRTYREVDWYDQWCALEVRQLDGRVQRVPPGRYQIERIRLDEEEVAQRSGVLVAFVGGQKSMAGLLYADGGSSEPPPTMDLVHFYLTGPDKNVLRLTCGGALSDGRLTDGPVRYRPDVRAINRILGEWGRLE